MTNTPFHEAVKHVGNLTKLAALIGRRQSTLQIWDARGWPAPEACPAIERATGGKFSRLQLLEPAFNESAVAKYDGRRKPLKAKPAKKRKAS